MADATILVPPKVCAKGQGIGSAEGPFYERVRGVLIPLGPLALAAVGNGNGDWGRVLRPRR